MPKSYTEWRYREKAGNPAAEGATAPETLRSKDR